MTTPILEYRGRANERKWSALAILALPAGILSFPALLHWTLLAQYNVGDSVLMILLIAWPSTGVVFCGYAWIHVAKSAGVLRGSGVAIAGLVIAFLWLLVAVLFLLYYKPGLASW